MWSQYWIPLLIPTLITRSNGSENKTDSSDTVFRSGGHADMDYQRHTTKTTTTPRTTTTVATTTTTEKIKETTAHQFEEATENVVFVPNHEPPLTRDENEFAGRGMRIHDLMMLKTVNDAMSKGFHVEKDDDTPKEDIVFITGKNHDFDNSVPEVKTRSKNEKNYNYKGQVVEDEREENEEERVAVQPKLNCTNLDCDNTIQSVCGGKLVNHEMRYRLFLNDCFFRKVNCGLKYEINRYIQVDNDKCKTIGAHVEKRFYYKTNPYRYKPDPNLHISGRRSPSARRSQTMNIDGQSCSHPCPITCQDDYDPQCAISDSGQRRTFLNHCKLDLHSCSYQVAWYKRPLSECVGGKKADMRQNRGFIGWMQRVGIVDTKGRLVLQ